MDRFEQGCRRARVDYNRCAEIDGDRPVAVFMNTLYLGRWYYDGYRPFKTEDEGRRFAQAWVGGQTVEEALRAAVSENVGS